MNNNIVLILDALVQLEENAGELYKLFSFTFPEDSSFWWQLYLEEMNHASLIEVFRDKFSSFDLIPQLLHNIEMKAIENENAELIKLLAVYKQKAPLRNEAFQLALTLENSAGEFHLQKISDSAENSEAVALFKKLNFHDKDHASRIKHYMSEQNIHR